MKAAFIDVDGIRTRFIEAGSGDPVVLLHGIGMSADCFHRNIEAVADSGRSVFAVDMLGHGFTDYARIGTTDPLGSLADHVLSFLRAVGIQRADLVGSSLGGGIAVECHLRKPDVIASCVVVGSSTPFVSAEILGAGLSRARENSSDSFRLGTYAALKRRLRYLVYDDAAVSEELIALQMTIYALADRRRAYDDIIDGIIALAGQTDVTPANRLQEIAVPVLAIAGQDDPRSPLETISEGIRRLPSGQLTIYENCGHFPFLEYPQRFTTDLLDFLECNKDRVRAIASSNTPDWH